MLLVLAWGGPSAADERLGEVVVTAPSAEERAAAKAPTAFATVIDTTAAPAGVETLGEALAESVGVQVRRFGGLGDFSTVSIRGSSAGQVQLFLDGVPLSRAENEVVNLSDLPREALDHVEVYRGTTPLAFAQSGPGGVVNVVTRRPGKEALTAASASGGSFATRKVDLARAASLGQWDYLAFAHYLGSAGDFRFTNDLGTTANPSDDRVETRVNNAFDVGDLTARLGYRTPAGAAAALTSETFVREQGVPGAGSVQAKHAHLSTIRQLGHLDATLPPPGGLPLETDASAWVVYDDRRFQDRQGEVALVRVDTETKSIASGGSLLLRGALGAHQVPGLLLAAGHEQFAEDDRERQLSAPERTRLRGTVAAEDEILAFGERLSFVPGLRWEIFRDDFPGVPGQPAAVTVRGTQVRDFVSPHAGVRLTPVRGLTLLGNAGRWAREPNLQELFGDSGVLVGNPNLRPEVAFNRDGGVRIAPPAVGRVLSHVALEYAYFDNEVEDLIALVQNSQRIVRPENVTRARIRGHEVSVRARVAERFGLTANYTHQNARDVGDVTFLRGKQLPGRPADEAYARVELGWSPTRPLPLGQVAARLWPGRIFYDINVIADDFLDRANVRRVGSRVLHGVGVELGLRPIPGVTAALEVKNLGDDHTRDVLGFPLPGRAVFATVSYGFGRNSRQDRGD